MAGARLSDRINGALQPSKHLVNSIAKCIGGNPASALVHGSARGYNLVTMTVSAGSVVRTMMGSNVVFLGPRTSEQVASVNVFNGGETTTGKTYTRTMAINGGAEAVQELMPEFEEVKKNLKGKDAAKRAAWLAQPQNAGHLAQLAAAGGDLSEPFSGSGDEYSAKFFKLASMLGSVAVNWTAETGACACASSSFSFLLIPSHPPRRQRFSFQKQEANHLGGPFAELHGRHRHFAKWPGTSQSLSPAIAIAHACHFRPACSAH